MKITIFHNPACGTSRNALALIRHAGIEPVIVEYLQAPPNRETLVELVSRMEVRLRTVLREKGTPFAELGLAEPSKTDDDILDAIEAHPILINRPIVVTESDVKLCRPSDVVLDLLPDVPLPDFVKDDGEPALRDRSIEGSDPRLASALAAAGLPTDDLTEPGRIFRAYETLSGRVVGYAGCEIYGEEALLRSLIVTDEARGRGFGGAILARICRRAFDEGAGRAHVLTMSAGKWFEEKGFSVVERSRAPSAILSTRQARSLCPSSASLLVRKIRL